MNKQKVVVGIIIVALGGAFAFFAFVRQEEQTSFQNTRVDGETTEDQQIVESDSVGGEVTAVAIVEETLDNTVTIAPEPVEVLPETQPVLELPNNINEVLSDEEKLYRQAAASPIAALKENVQETSTDDNATPATTEDPRITRAIAELEALAPVPPPVTSMSPAAQINANDRFRNNIAARDSGDVGQVNPAAARYIINEGTIFSAVLETAINSELPGVVRARITRPIYDSINLQQIAIPRGSVALGEYNSSVLVGQNRVYMIFHRIIFPDGRSISLVTGGTDAAGASGIVADTNKRFFERFGLSLLAGIGAFFVDDLQAVDSEGNAINSTAGTILSETLADVRADAPQYKPIFTVKAGERVHMFANQDIILGFRR